MKPAIDTLQRSKTLSPGEGLQSEKIFELFRYTPEDATFTVFVSFNKYIASELQIIS